MNFDTSSTLTLLILIALTALIVSTYMELRKKPKKPEYITRELLECTNCKYRLETDYEAGDFISLYKRACPKCGSPMKIIAIYNIEKKNLIPS